jgi:hypothetical protein
MINQIVFNEESTIYIYDGVLYTSHFPEEWAKSHINGTGPKCRNCDMVGYYNGVFIGYCANCAKYVYNNTRGLGFIDYGIEVPCIDPDDEKYSALNTYLKYVKNELYRLGDFDLYGERFYHKDEYDMKKDNENREKMKDYMLYYIEEYNELKKKLFLLSHEDERRKSKR